MEVQRVPRHVGIIVDGNRRFAKRLILKPFMGHEWGAKKLEKLMEWAVEYKIKELTLYTLSVQNFFSRPKEELSYLLDLFKREIKRLKDDERISRYKIKVNFIGRLSLFDEEMQALMNEVMNNTKNNNNLSINLAMAYGGQEEVLDAVKKISEQVKKGDLDISKINKEVFEDNLYLKSSPDLIIRTGGEKRTSNFLNYQSAYSEWIFLEKMFPEFEKEDFIECLQEYSKRERRFGR